MLARHRQRWWKCWSSSCLENAIEKSAAMGWDHGNPGKMPMEILGFEFFQAMKHIIISLVACWQWASAVLSLWAVGTSTWVLAPRSLGDCKGKRALVPGCGRAYDAIALAEYGFDRDWAALATAHVVAVVVCLGIDSGITCWLNTHIYIYVFIYTIFQYKFAFVGSSVGSQFVLLQNAFV